METKAYQSFFVFSHKKNIGIKLFLEKNTPLEKNQPLILFSEDGIIKTIFLKK